MIEAELPDGTVLEFPDGTADAVIRRTVKRQLGVAEAEPPASAPPVPEPGPMRSAVPESEPTSFYRDDEDQLHYRHPPSPHGWPDPGTMFLGGARNALVGLASLPFDIAGSEWGDAIRKNVPVVDPRGTAENVGQIAVQYGLPSVAVAGKSVQMLEQVWKNAPSIAKWITGIAASGASDLAVSDPSRDGTIGDLTGGPTATERGDSPLARRAKIGAEGVAVPLAVDSLARPMVGAAKVVGRGVRAATRPFTKEGQKDIVARALDEVVPDKAQAVRNIDETVARHGDDPYFNPTTGQASNDTGLIATERTYQNDTGVLDRYRRQAAGISRNKNAVTQIDKPGPEGDAAADFYRGQRRGMLDKADEGVESAQSRVATAEGQLDEVADQSVTPHGTKGDASETLDRQVRGKLDEMTGRKSDLFDSIDPERTLEIDPAPIRDVAKNIRKTTGPLDETPGKLPPVVAKVARLGKKTTTVGGVKKVEDVPVHFGDLQDLRPELSAAIKKARAEGEGEVVRRLTTLKRTLEDYTEEAADAGSKEARDAIDYYKSEFAPRFREGEGGKFANAVRREPKAPGTLPPTKTASRFLKSGEGSREAAADLKRIVGNDPEGVASVRKYLIGDLADYLGDPKHVTPQKMDRWIARRREVLDQFPSVRDEVMHMRNQVASATDTVTQMRGELDDAVKARKMTEDEMNLSATRLFIDSDPVKAVGRVMESSNPAEKMSELVSAARKDPSGEAVQGLKKAVSRWVDEKVTNTARGVQDELAVSLASVENLFKNPAQRKALERIYTPGEMAQLNKVRDQLHVMNRKNVKATTNSSTFQDMATAADRARILLASTYGIVKGRGVFMVSKWVMRQLGKDPVDMANKLMRDALLDPELARTLLMRVTEETQPIIKRRLRTYIANNVLAEPGEEDEDNGRGVPEGRSDPGRGAEAPAVP